MPQESNIHLNPVYSLEAEGKQVPLHLSCVVALVENMVQMKCAVCNFSVVNSYTLNEDN